MRAVRHAGVPLAIWLVPTLAALMLYGVGQGLVKKYIAEVPPARFCLYFVVMGMMAAGDIGVIVATRYGPVSLITPLSGAYPLVTVVFARVVLGERLGLQQAICIAAILGGMLLTPGPG